MHQSLFRAMREAEEAGYLAGSRDSQSYGYDYEDSYVDDDYGYDFEDEYGYDDEAATKYGDLRESRRDALAKIKEDVKKGIAAATKKYGNNPQRAAAEIQRVRDAGLKAVAQVERKYGEISETINTSSKIGHWAIQGLKALGVAAGGAALGAGIGAGIKYGRIAYGRNKSVKDFLKDDANAVFRKDPELSKAYLKQVKAINKANRFKIADDVKIGDEVIKLNRANREPVYGKGITLREATAIRRGDGIPVATGLGGRIKAVFTGGPVISKADVAAAKAKQAAELAKFARGEYKLVRNPFSLQNKVDVRRAARTGGIVGAGVGGLGYGGYQLYTRPDTEF